MPMILLNSPKEGPVYLNTQCIVVLERNAENQGNSNVHVAFGVGAKTLVVNGQPAEIAAKINDAERRQFSRGMSLGEAMRP